MMAQRTPDPRPPAELAASLPRGGVILVVTDDGQDPRYALARDAAARIASALGGRVVLFHAPPGALVPGGRSRHFVPPDPAAAGQAVRPHTGSRRSDLLLAEASAIRSGGADVSVWLARTSGPGAIADAVAATGAAMVLLCAEAPRAGTPLRRVDRTLAYYASRIPVPVLSVGTSGRPEPVAPLGCSLVASARRLLSGGSPRRPSIARAAGAPR
jgi:hypothetical protein